MEIPSFSQGSVPKRPRPGYLGLFFEGNALKAIDPNGNVSSVFPAEVEMPEPTPIMPYVTPVSDATEPSNVESFTSELVSNLIAAGLMESGA